MNEDSMEFRNLMAVKDYSKVTRELLRDLETKVEDSVRTNTQLSQKVILLETQLRAMQVKLFTGGATS